ncbi:MAG: lysine--tRNA ligase, partial [Chloroflexi bacterium]
MWQPTRVEQDRLNKVAELEALGIDLYPARVQRTHTTAEALAAYEKAEAANPESPEEIAVTVCGRIRRANIKGKVAFMHIEDEHGRIQLFFRINDVGEEAYEPVRQKLIEVDDFIQASGTMMRTKAGEISVRVQAYQLLAKSL